MKKAVLKKKVDRVWKQSKKDLNIILKNTNFLLKEGEHYIKDKSEKGKEQLEIMALILKREKLYYELGKAVARLPKNKWTTTKKVSEISDNIKKVTLQIGKKKKEVKIAKRHRVYAMVMVEREKE